MRAHVYSHGHECTHLCVLFHSISLSPVTSPEITFEFYPDLPDSISLLPPWNWPVVCYNFPRESPVSVPLPILTFVCPLAPLPLLQPCSCASPHSCPLPLLHPFRRALALLLLHLPIPVDSSTDFHVSSSLPHYPYPCLSTPDPPPTPLSLHQGPSASTHAYILAPLPLLLILCLLDLLLTPALAYAPRHPAPSLR